MESKDELEEPDTKNHTCYYFDDIMKVRDIDFGNILLEVKIYKKYFNLSHFIQNFYGLKTIAHVVR